MTALLIVEMRAYVARDVQVTELDVTYKTHITIDIIWTEEAPAGEAGLIKEYIAGIGEIFSLDVPQQHMEEVPTARRGLWRGFMETLYREDKSFPSVAGGGG